MIGCLSDGLEEEELRVMMPGRPVPARRIHELETLRPFRLVWSAHSGFTALNLHGNGGFNGGPGGVTNGLRRNTVIDHSQALRATEQAETGQAITWVVPISVGVPREGIDLDRPEADPGFPSIPNRQLCWNKSVVRCDKFKTCVTLPLPEVKIVRYSIYLSEIKATIIQSMNYWGVVIIPRGINSDLFSPYKVNKRRLQFSSIHSKCPAFAPACQVLLVWLSTLYTATMNFWNNSRHFCLKRPV